MRVLYGLLSKDPNKPNTGKSTSYPAVKLHKRNLETDRALKLFQHPQNLASEVRAIVARPHIRPAATNSSEHGSWKVQVEPDGLLGTLQSYPILFPERQS